MNRLHVFTTRRLREMKRDLMTEAFAKGWDARGEYDGIEVTGKGVVLPGFDAVKEAEKIVEGR